MKQCAGKGFSALFYSLFVMRRAVVSAVCVLPLMLIVILSAPAIMILPFTPKGQEFILKFIESGTKWVQVVLASQGVEATENSMEAKVACDTPAVTQGQTPRRQR
ncbi:hypothetical protein ACWDLG_04020 [Nonomuraea sp. NPDC003727]